MYYWFCLYLKVGKNLKKGMQSPEFIFRYRILMIWFYLYTECDSQLYKIE